MATTANPLKPPRERRCSYWQLVEFSVGSANDQDMYKGITVNLSKSGLCLYVASHLGEGQEIFIRTGIRVSQPAVVLWCKQLDECLYKIGLRLS